MTSSVTGTVVTGLRAKTPNLDPERIGDVVHGNVNGAGEDNRNVARMAVLLAGLPVTVPATTVNRLCGLSLDAAVAASRLAAELRERRERWGVAAICIAVGQGLAVVLDNVDVA
jgi:acetyl-CoA acetyltransferase